MSAEVVTGIANESLDIGALIDSARRGTCSVVAPLIGVVCNHGGGEGVDTIEYSSHPSPQQILRDVITEFKDHPGAHRIVAWHYAGYLGIGEDVMVVVAAAEHRVQAFRVVKAIVEDVRTKLPIQKKQELTDDSHNWSGL